jgi:hypothetical protein
MERGQRLKQGFSFAERKDLWHHHQRIRPTALDFRSNA